MEIMSQSSGNVIGLRIDDTLRGEDYAAVVPKLEQLMAEHDKIRILARIDQMTGVEPEAIWDDLKLGRHMNHFARMAIVTDREWIRRLTGVMSAVTPMAIRYFPLAEEEMAWRWLREDTTD